MAPFNFRDITAQLRPEFRKHVLMTSMSSSDQDMTADDVSVSVLTTTKPPSVN